MKTSLLLVALLSLALPGCGRTMLKESKETVIEKQATAPEVRERKEVIVQQPVVTREVIVERQPLSTSPRYCAYSQALFSSGTHSCQGGQRMLCDDGVWLRRGLTC